MPKITDYTIEAVFAQARRDGHSHLVAHLDGLGRGYAVVAVPELPVEPSEGGLVHLIVEEKLAAEAAAALAARLCGLDDSAEIHCIEFI